MNDLDFDENLQYDENWETEYEKKGWDHNVWNCNIDLTLSIMVSSDEYESNYNIANAFYILGELKIKNWSLCSCGRWNWIEFEKIEDLVAYKLKKDFND